MKQHVPVQIETRVGPGGDIETIEHHPSFGLIKIGRYSCNPAQNFFGSTIKHHAGISLSICTATKHRNLSNDWYFHEQEIVEVNMTAAQLSDLLTSMNVGDGVPCTISHLHQSPDLAAQYPGVLVPLCPETTKRQDFEEEFKKEMRGIAEKLDELVAQAKALQNKSSINKGDRKAFVDIAETLRCKIANSLPFIQGQFNEAIEKTITDAKASVEEFVGQVARTIGNEAIREKLLATTPKLSLGGGEDYTTPAPAEAERPTSADLGFYTSPHN